MKSHINGQHDAQQAEFHAIIGLSSCTNYAGHSAHKNLTSSSLLT